MSRNTAALVLKWTDALGRDEFDANRLGELRQAWPELEDSFTETDRTMMENTAGLTPEDVGRMIAECDSPADIERMARELAAASRGCACAGEDPPEPTLTDIDEAASLLLKRAVTPALWAISLRFGSSAG